MKAFLTCLLAILLVATFARAEKVEFKNGDKLDVKILEDSGSKLVVEHPQLGRMVIEKDELKPKEKPKPGLLGTSFMKGWSRNLGAGWAGSTGNSSQANINASLAASRSTDSFRGKFSSSYFFAMKDSARITNEFFADYQHNFIIRESKYFVFVESRYQYDQFQAWGHRLSSSGGIGYDIVKSKTFTFNGKFGSGVARTWGTERDWSPEGVLGLSLTWKPIDRHSLTADVTYYPDFAKLPEFRLLANAAYTMGITRIGGLSLKVGAKNEYDSGQPDKKNNLKYYGNLVYDF